MTTQQGYTLVNVEYTARITETWEVPNRSSHSFIRHLQDAPSNFLREVTETGTKIGSSPLVEENGGDTVVTIVDHTGETIEEGVIE